MDNSLIITFVILAAAIVAFVTDRIPADLVALLVASFGALILRRDVDRTLLGARRQKVDLFIAPVTSAFLFGPARFRPPLLRGRMAWPWTGAFFQRGLRRGF